MKDKLETTQETIERIEKQRQSIENYKTSTKVASHGHFFNFKIMTLKDLQERNLTQNNLGAKL